MWFGQTGQMASDKRAARLGVLAAVAVLLFGALGVRLWFLQTVEATELQDSVEVERTKTVRLVPERGRIFDADGRILADNERILTVGIDWEVMRDKNDRSQLFKRLSGWIDTPVAEMERRYNANLYSPYLPMPVKEDIDEPTASALMERSEDFPGVQVELGWRRAYPYAPLASPVIGYLGLIPEEQADEYVRRGYVLSEQVGSDGIELSMEDTLHGKWGEKVVRVNAAGQILEEISRREAINGQDIQLSIDLDVQQYAEQILQTQLKLRRTFTAKNPIVTKEEKGGIKERIDPSSPPEVNYKAPAGSVIVTNQKNGQISAMATYPTFDHRWFNSGISGDKFAELFPGEDSEGFDPDKATLLNRAVQGQYNLGSSFKPFTAYAALHSGFMEPGSFYEDQGTYKMRSIDPAECRSGRVRCEFRNSNCGDSNLPCVYGSVNVQTALAVSSDTFFYRIGEELFLRRENLLRDEVKRWGFGQETGVDLPYEFDGRVPDDQLKRDLIASEALDPDTDVDRLLAGDNVQTAIGQGLLAASPLQVAQAYAALGNRGAINTPRVVRAIYKPGVPNGTPGYVDLSKAKLVQSFLKGGVSSQVPIDGDALQAIVSGLRQNITGPGVTLPDGGVRSTTAEELFEIGYPEQAIPIAGKTGTAQGSKSLPWNDSSAFAAFSLDDTRPYTVVAYLEKAGFGSQGAAPVVKCMYLALSGLIQTRPVELADPLDLDSTEAAADVPAAETKCLESSNFDPNPAD